MMPFLMSLRCNMYSLNVSPFLQFFLLFIAVFLSMSIQSNAGVHDITT